MSDPSNPRHHFEGDDAQGALKWALTQPDARDGLMVAYDYCRGPAQRDLYSMIVEHLLATTPSDAVRQNLGQIR